MQIINPTTEEIEEIAETPLEEIATKVACAKTEQKSWGLLSVTERASILQGLVPLLKAQRDTLAATITRQMGKPLNKAQQEIELVQEYVNFFCKKAPEWLAPEQTEEGYVSFDPIGVVAVISPWNFPYGTAFLALLPALLTGNGILFKPSEYCAQTGCDIQDLFSQLTDFPDGLLQLIIGGKRHGQKIVQEKVQMIAFTGSTLAGKEIMRQAADGLKKVILELGGLDAAIVLKDADIPFTAQQIVERNCVNTGQVCCSIKRVYVEEEVYNAFVAAAVEVSKRITFGDPNKQVNMGPMVADFQRKKVEEILKDAKRKGAQVHTGGHRPEGCGYFYPSTILTDVTHEMRVMHEEPFGPLLPIYPVPSWKKAVELANDTPYGLTGSIWTRDLETGKKIASQLEVGVAGINIHGAGPAGTPWGGAKESGLGRMKSQQGMREFTNVKLVRVHEQPEVL